MILPTKHTGFSQSLLGFGGYLLSLLDTPKSVDALWAQYQRDFEKGVMAARHSFDKLILTLVFLHTIGVVYEENGEVIKCA